MAPSAEEASLEVIRLVASDPRIEQAMTDWVIARPDIAVDQVIELPPGATADAAPLGFVFYTEDESDRPDLDPGFATEEELGI